METYRSDARRQTYDPEQLALDELRDTVQPAEGPFSKIREMMASWQRRRGMKIEEHVIGAGFQAQEKEREEVVQNQEERGNSLSQVIKK